MFHFLRYELWPLLKVRATYGWWIIKYGGKKNIPQEILFGQLAKSVERMTKNLEAAQRSIPLEEMSEENREQLRELMIRVREFEGGAKEMRGEERKL